MLDDKNLKQDGKTKDNLNADAYINNTNKIKIIVNADDLGICEERDAAIFELYKNGSISSASILVNGINFENSVSRAKELKMPLGLHLNLT